MSELMSQRLPLIGRTEEKARIARAIRGEGPSILFMEGIAGLGKTFLLEEAGQIARDAGSLCPPIVDFYDTEMHAHPALEATIAQNLDPEKAAFCEYWTRRAEMERAPLPERKTLKEQQKALWDAFLQGYSRLADQQRVVLRFDTAERLEYERDSEEVLADCEVLPQDAPSWEWLLGRIGDLPKTTTLIAARPTASGLLRKKLLDAHEGQVDHLTIRRFNLEETEAYFRATDFGKQVADEAPEMVQKLHLLSDGRPILIALALDWLARGRWDSLYSVRLGELQTWQSEAWAEEQPGAAWRRWEEVKRNFEVALVQKIRDLDHTGLDIAVNYAALARKGYNADLLSRLMGVPTEEAERLVAELQKLSFIKAPRGPRQLFFLHDEMYDLVEKYIWKVDWPDYSKQACLDRIIIDWYNAQIEDLAQRIKDARDWRERSDLRRKQQLLMAERLYYQFDSDPRQGYREYTRLDEEAISARELEQDTFLRNEALWFTAHRSWRVVERGPTRRRNGQIERSPWVDCDCRRRWVGRYIARNEWQKAARVAERLLEKECRPEEPELYRPGLRVALATAQAYMGGEYVEPALENFQRGIREIEHAFDDAPDEHRNPWLQNHLLGTAHLYRGLALRNTLRLSETVRAYQQAAYCFRQNNYLPGPAEALNNLAYIYARQGDPERALGPCNEALRIREELGDEYPIGLSLNTKAIIYERRGLPETAIRFSQQALEMFQRIPNERGVVLAEINLGRSYRRKGRSPDWHIGGDFEQGERFLRGAITRMEGWGTDREIFYEVEAYDELGCLYRDWVATLYERYKERDPQQLVPHLENGVKNLERARSLLQEDGIVPEKHAFQYVDVTEDLARVYYWWARVEPEWQMKWWDKALKLLEKALEITNQHVPQPESGFLRGKIHHQLARIAREQKDGKAAEYYALAAGWLESYSLYLPELRKTVNDAADWLISLSSKEEAKQQIKVMQDTLDRNELMSSRLQEWVDDVVSPQVGVGWSELSRTGDRDQEVADG